MPTLYSYCLRYDAGSAPNPYWGICSLAICKPAIRRSAKVGDWVVGLGSTNTDIGDLSSHVLYAMKVTEKITMEEYDLYCKKELEGKIPVWSNNDYIKKVGDCIYDYSVSNTPKLRLSVHDKGNITTDLSGKNVLLSDNFYYFGNNAIQLPEDLKSIAHPYVGFKSHKNKHQAESFISWIKGLGFERNIPLGEPLLKEEIIKLGNSCRSVCSSRDEEDNKDEKIHTVCPPKNICI